MRERIRLVLDTSLDLVQDLDELTGGAAKDLFRAHERIEARVRERLEHEAARPPEPLVVSLDDPAAVDRERTGGKAAHLAALRGFLPEHVPAGFVATTTAYGRVAASLGLAGRVRGLLTERRGDEPAGDDRGRELRRLIEEEAVPDDVARAIREAAASRGEVVSWAVRSSGVGEDGEMSFAGQFDTRLGVPVEGLLDAYRAVAASRFSDRALAYREGAGLAEVETPMAVLFLPMIAARAAGVLYTRDANDPTRDVMWLSSTLGLGSELVGGTAGADMFVVAREPPGTVLDRWLASKDTTLVTTDGAEGVRSEAVPAAQRVRASVDDPTIGELARLGLAIERRFGGPQDIEWAQDRDGRLWILQSRPLPTSRAAVRHPPVTAHPVLVRGRPLAPGRAAGPVHRALTPAQLDAAPEGSVLVVRQATPEIARVLSRIAAVVAEAGNPQSHAAALVRQAEVPGVWDAGGALDALKDGDAVGVDGTRGEVYAGSPWPGMRRRPPRVAGAGAARATGFAHELILRLDLVDPTSDEFTADRCRSIHDLVRLVHERALEGMFRLGDRHAGGRRRAARHLASEVPIDLDVLDLGRAIADTTGRGNIEPKSVLSIPFQALWKGIADPRVSWAGRRVVSTEGFLSVVLGAVAAAGGGMRRLGDRNYLVVAPDYVNLNARLAYHYAMIDALVGELPENNYVTFRFQGGGAGPDRRDLRARFAGDVLAALGFAVDRRGDLLNAWLRAAPRAASEAALTSLGLLMACARQLDMLIADDADVRRFVQSFLAEDYGSFA